MTVQIEPFGQNCIIKAELSGGTYQQLTALPGFKKWKSGSRDMIFRPTSNNIRYIRETWPDAQWKEGTEHHLDNFIKEQKEAMQASENKKIILEDDGSYEYKTKPFDHQRQAFLLCRDQPRYALFMEQGTGKTKVAIDKAAYCYSRGKIEAMIIIAPNGVHANWIEEEIPAHLPEWCPRKCWVYSSKMTKARQKEFDDVFNAEDCLKIFAFNVEGFTSTKAQNYLEKIINSFSCYIPEDESQYIKNNSAKRTKYLTKVCENVPEKLIMTGTSVTKGIEDLFGQFSWLDKEILGFDSFYTFRNHFCTMGGYEMKQIVGYKNIDQLISLIDPYSYRVTKKDCLDLPDKIYKRWIVEMTPKQRKIYEDLKHNFWAELEDAGTITADLAIVRLLRLQQVTCGWFPNDEMTPIPGDNVKLEAVRQHCKDTNGPVIVWARFAADIKNMTEELRRDHGRDVVFHYYGGTPEDQRSWIRKAFQEGKIKALVAHPKAAGRGLTMTKCENPIYHSNDFDLELRLQSEDRTHRIGTVNNVTYTDVEAKKTIDRKIITALRKKKSIADMVNKDTKTLFLEE